MNPDLEKDVAELKRLGASPQEITAYIAEHRQKMITPKAESSAASPMDPQKREFAAQETFGDLAKGVGRSALHGATLGSSDEILASGRALLTGDRVSDALTKERKALSDFRERHPEGSFLSEAAGAFVPAAAANIVAPGMGMIGGGALFGGLYGAGESEGTHDLALRAGVGTAVGAGTGGLLRGAGAVGRVGYDIARGVGKTKPVQATSQAIGKYLPTVKQHAQATGDAAAPIVAAKPLPTSGGAGGGKNLSVPGAFAPRSPEDRASLMMLERLKADKQTPASVRTAIEKSQKPRAIGDVSGENTLALQRWSRSVPSEARQDVPKALYERQAGMQERLIGDASELTGATRRQVPQAIEQRATQRAAEAKPMFDALRESDPVDGNLFVEILGTPAGAQAIKQAERTALNQRRPFPAVFDENGAARPLSFDDVQQIKMAFDDLLGSPPSPLESGGLGKVNAAAIRNLKNDFLGIAEDAFPGYADANATFAGHSAIMNAMDDGARFFKMPADEAALAMQKMSASEKEAFVDGALSSLADKIEKGMGTFDMTRRVILPTNEQKRLRLLFPDDESFNQFVARAEEEAAMRHSLNTTVGGSQTFEKMQEGVAADDSAIGFASDAAQRKFGSMLDRMRNSTLSARARGLNQETANALGPMLTAGMRGDKDQIIRVLERLAEAEMREAQRRAVRGTAGRAVSGSASGTATRF